MRVAKIVQMCVDAPWRTTARCALVALMLSGCAELPVSSGRLDIRTTAASQPLTDVHCVVETGAGKWTVLTPGAVQVGAAAGDLRVVCTKPGYRSSEVIVRFGGSGGAAGTRVGVGIAGGAGSGSGVGISLGMGFPFSGGRRDYPSEIVVEMTPQSP